MSIPVTSFQCIQCSHPVSLEEPQYACPACGSLLEVYFDRDWFKSRSPQAWKDLFDSRLAGQPGPDGSGVWRFREWILPDLPEQHIVTLGEGGSALTRSPRLNEFLGIDLLTKQCGHTLSGSFKDLGMTVLISHVNRLRKEGKDIPAVACASTGDTSAALAAYGAAAGIRTLVLLPSGKVSAAQLVQPLSHGAKVLAIDTDFDGCMTHVQELCAQANVYLANSKNSLRIEGQKTVAFEICQGLRWQLPDWVVIPGGNLGNVSALVRGFQELKLAGITTKIPRVMCAQASAADPLYKSYLNDFAPLEAQQAQETMANAIRIGNPISFPKAVSALKASNGVVTSVSEQQLAEAAREADTHGFFLCPHTAVAYAGIKQGLNDKLISQGDQVVVVSTAHGLKFTEFKNHCAANTIPSVSLDAPFTPIDVEDDLEKVLGAALT